ncbi:uncharacterized protein BDR25DRAFT_21930 [Lindgomyces ingoldianus]|uniref:Uncharacterized protein n=1 Tax=Lindgomyces ingoldianus TaxID=673940 RepID=A0ACB6QZZ0_9PLEO|nr:uncharacterized protein BDR25DRAFT_21930 [Lindgomyces ingoldianus]KAF2471635.1 hypothetical protein BDR25DRAFT_21930 [Lindgomyces ingoldianus]
MALSPFARASGTIRVLLLCPSISVGSIDCNSSTQFEGHIQRRTRQFDCRAARLPETWREWWFSGSLHPRTPLSQPDLVLSSNQGARNDLGPRPWAFACLGARPWRTNIDGSLERLFGGYFADRFLPLTSEITTSCLSTFLPAGLPAVVRRRATRAGALQTCRGRQRQ